MQIEGQLLWEPLQRMETTLPQLLYSELSGRALHAACILLCNCLYTIAYTRERLKNACTAFTSGGFANADEFESMHHHAKFHLVAK